MKHVFVKAIVSVAIGSALVACQEKDMSYDAINGPENVLQAPLFSDENLQQDPTNAALREAAIADSMFFVRAKAAVADSAAAAVKTDSAAEKSM